jgi:peptidoglycan/xylan/chitin deacetylase (PgdA/CDA1 family)
VIALAATAVVAAIPRELDRLPTRRKVVALTIDCGGNAVGGWTVYRTLRRKHAPATFFLTGDFVRANPRLARAIGRRFGVGDHTVDHATLPTLPSARVFREIDVARREIRAATGRDPKPFFRFPYGASDARTLRIVARLGYVSVRWTVDTLGWMGTTGGQTVPRAVRRVEASLEPGAIVLMHVGAARDGSEIDVHALPAVIDAIRRRGYSFTTLDSLRPRSR